MSRKFYGRKQNPAERVMRPGLLLLALLIAFGFVYVLSPDQSMTTAVADGDSYETAMAGDDEETASDENLISGDQAVPENEPDDATTDEGYRGGPGGENYDDGETGPGDAENDGDGNAGTPSGSGGDDATSEGDEEEEDARHRECIWVRGINGYNVIDDKHLTVRTSPRRVYLVTLWNRCYDLRWSHQLAIKSYGSWTCSHSRDYIITGENRCIIDNIERVESHDEAVEIVAERTGESDSEDDESE